MRYDLGEENETRGSTEVDSRWERLFKMDRESLHEAELGHEGVEKELRRSSNLWQVKGGSKKRIPFSGQYGQRRGPYSEHVRVWSLLGWDSMVFHTCLLGRR